MFEDADRLKAVPGSEVREGLPSVSIIIPAYGAAQKLQRCLESLALHCSACHTIFVLDDATPDTTLRVACEEMNPRLPQLRYIRSEINRGFVVTCNWGFEQFREPSSDLLLLNSDAEVTPGFLEEMQSVLYIHEKHAAVTPRSNNATIFSVPWSGEPLPPCESYELWCKIRHRLPRYCVMPTAVGFCMLIKSEVLDRFDLFDEAYSPGYNEENDFFCRINRYGYSPVAANWAYVFHHESSSFGPQRQALESSHHKLLLKRYPEYEQKVSDYSRFRVDPVETFAILEAPHRPRILYDLFHLPAAHTGTSDFGLNLLREVGRLLEEEYELHVGLYQPDRFFDHELAGYRIYSDRDDAPMVFDLIFKPCQLFSWPEFHRMNRLAPRVTYTMQDIIGVRCEYLNSPGREILFQKTAELSDCVFTISEFSRSDFAAFYGRNVSMRVIHHGTNFHSRQSGFQQGSYVLVMGNYFAHKGVADALARLNRDLPITVLGGSKTSECNANVRWLTSGDLSRQEMREVFAKAQLLVYPSHYEGFGLPVVDALALGKPVIVLDSEVNRELAERTRDKNLHRIRTLNELEEAVKRLFHQSAEPPEVQPRSWRAAAEEYVAEFRELLTRDIDSVKLRARWDMLRTLDSLSHFRGEPRRSGN